MSNVAPVTEHVFAPMDGPELRYAVRGNTASASLVFIHGWPDSWRSFEPVLEALPPAVSAISGFGGSSAPATGFTPADFAADVQKLVDHLGITSAACVGHSMGSLVAQRLAAAHPRWLAGLILIGGFNRLADDAFDEVWSVLQNLSDAPDEAFVRAFQSSTLARPIAAPLFDQIVGESMKAPARVWKAAFAGIRAMPPDSLARISAPTLLLWGDHDALVPRTEQNRLLAAISGARLIVYEGAGHSPNWEEPAHVASDIAKFLEQLGRSLH
jgi:non-heme chloroperoxidase